MLAIGDPGTVNDTLYRIKFRTGSIFHNGEQMTADDIVFSINRLVSEENGYFYRQFIGKPQAVPHRKAQQSVVLEHAHRRQGFAKPPPTKATNGRWILHKGEAGRAMVAR